jgi:MFS family permease
MRIWPRAGPRRVLAVSNFVFTLGSGLYLTAGVLYFTEAVGLPAARVGLGLGVAGFAALAAGVLVGHLADRFGARGVYAVTLIVQATATAGFLLVHGFWPFVVTVTVAGAAKAAGTAARSPLIRAYGGDQPQRFRAYLRAVSNAGISIGALAAGWVVQVGSQVAYESMVIGIAGAVAGAAVVLVFAPAVAPMPVAAGPRWTALRDRPYLVLTALDGLMSIQYKVLTVAVPLWVVGMTNAPHWVISATMLTGTILVVLFQVRASRSVDTPRAGGRAYRRAGLAFLVSCSVISLAEGVPGWVAAVLLIGAVVVHTAGELWHSAGTFEVSFGLAPEHATGQYLGVFGLGTGLSDAVGPALLIGLCISWGRPGWYVVGALFALTGAVVPLAVARARHRPIEQPMPRVAIAAGSGPVDLG